MHSHKTLSKTKQFRIGTEKELKKPFDSVKRLYSRNSFSKDQRY